MKNKLFYFAILLFLTSNLKAQISIFDAKFGKKGGTYTNLGFLNTGKLLVVQPDKRILAAGTDPDADTLGFAQNFFFVKRLNVNGTIDTTFGKKGIVSVQTIDKSFVAPINMLLQNDGKIVLISYLSENNKERSIIHRLNTDGTADNTFGTNGAIETGVNNAGERLNDAVILADGSLVCIGQINNDSNTKIGLLVEKYDKNGNLDITFGKLGQFTYFSDDYILLFGSHIGRQKKDGAYILYAGALDFTLSFDAFLFKISSNGFLENGFGNSGIVTVDKVSGDNFPIMMSVLPNDEILALDKQNKIENTLLQKFLPDGNIDITFANNSKLNIKDTDPILTQTIQDFVITNDQKILLSGTNADTTNTSFGLLFRYNANGTQDISFGKNGRLDLQYQDSYTSFNNLLLLNSGKILCNGYGTFKDSTSYSGIFQIDPSLYILSSKEATDITKINLYPNPVSNQATLNIELLSTQSLDILLFDINGRWVSDFRTTNDTFAAGKNEILLDLPSSLTSGTYFVNIRSQEGVSVVKMVKM